MGARLALVLSLIVLPATARADLWEYRTESGTLAYTDDTERIPARYRESAVQRPTAGLADYERLSVSEPGAAIASTKTSIDLEALESGERSRSSAPPPAQKRMSLGLGAGFQVELDRSSDDPIVVERKLYRTRSDGVTTTFTVISQGGRDLAIINE